MGIKVLITGVGGFIGFSFAKYLLQKKNFKIIGIDNLNNYYSVKLKQDRIKILNKFRNFQFYRNDICKVKKLKTIFKKRKFDYIFHFAAQAGVRYSLVNPRSYIDNNIVGFFNLLECSKKKPPKKFFYASSSSVYGDSKVFPLRENLFCKQKNVYSLSKKINEDLAEIYSNFYNIKFVGLRFFTVYGEWGRPDMFYLKYLDSLKKNKTISIYNYGNHIRDFTYILDVVEILKKLIFVKLKNKHQLFNVCSNKPIKLTKVISLINSIYKGKPKIKKIRLQRADVIKTHGDNKKLLSLIKKRNFYSLRQGLVNTVNWYKNYNL